MGTLFGTTYGLDFLIGGGIFGFVKLLIEAHWFWFFVNLIFFLCWLFKWNPLNVFPRVIVGTSLVLAAIYISACASVLYLVLFYEGEGYKGLFYNQWRDAKCLIHVNDLKPSDETLDNCEVPCRIAEMPICKATMAHLTHKIKSRPVCTLEQMTEVHFASIYNCTPKKPSDDYIKMATNTKIEKDNYHSLPMSAYIYFEKAKAKDYSYAQH
jgi:hypothetical protein